MTEQLSRLLHDTASDAPVPPPPAHGVLAEGHRLRRRRRTALAGGVASLAAVAVLGTALLVPGADDDARGDRGVDTAAPTAPADPTFAGVTWALGNEVFLDGGDEVVEIDDTAVKSLYYSSAGIVVRHGDNSSSDGGGPQRFTLIRPDGTTSPISVETEETAHAVDPDEPYLAWAEPAPGGAEVVVRDVDTDTEVARVPVDGEFSWSPPPVALDGDTAYVGGRDGQGLLAVDWRTGEVRDTEVASEFPEVAGGNAVVYGDDGPDVIDLASADLEYDADADTLRLSPDGRYAVASSFDVRRPWKKSSEVVDVEGVETSPAQPQPIGFDRELTGQVGWSSAGQPFSIDGGTLTVCSTTTSACESRTVDLDVEDFPQLGGVTYES